MRPRFLKDHSLWDAFLLDLDRELSKIRGHKTIERETKKLLRLYLAIGLKSTGIPWKEVATIMRKRFSLRLTRKHRTYLQKARIPDRISWRQDGKALPLGEVLGPLCPEQLTGAPVSKDLGLRMKRRIERKLKERRRLKLIDRIALLYIEDEYLFCNAYGKRFGSRFVAARVVRYYMKRGIKLSERSVLREIRSRLYRRYLRQREVSS